MIRTCSPSLLRALPDTHPSVRMAAVQALARQEPATIEPIVTRFFPRLLTDPDTFVRIETMEAIGRLGCVSPFFSQLTSLLHEEEPLLRYHAICVLARWDDPQVTRVLLPLCQDEDALVGEAAQEAVNARSTRGEQHGITGKAGMGEERCGNRKGACR